MPPHRRRVGKGWSQAIHSGPSFEHAWSDCVAFGREVTKRISRRPSQDTLSRFHRSGSAGYRRTVAQIARLPPGVVSFKGRSVGGCADDTMGLEPPAVHAILTARRRKTT